MEILIRLLPYSRADGQRNMAADEALVHSAALGRASVRFYGWDEATLSLGYFQPASARLGDPRLARLPFVRRPSGGSAIVHHHELTYALALPPGAPWHTAESWMPRMHRVIIQALADLGVQTPIEPVRGPTVAHGNVLCFQQLTAGDLVSAGRKVVGSAQRKHRQALLQHGSILLAQSEHTPDLPGLLETAGARLEPAILETAMVKALAVETLWRVAQDDWTGEELARIDELARKYRSAEWNERRA